MRAGWGGAGRHCGGFGDDGLRRSRNSNRRRRIRCRGGTTRRAATTAACRQPDHACEPVDQSIHSIAPRRQQTRPRPDRAVISHDIKRPVFRMDCASRIERGKCLPLEGGQDRGDSASSSSRLYQQDIHTSGCIPHQGLAQEGPIHERAPGYLDRSRSSAKSLEYVLIRIARFLANHVACTICSGWHGYGPIPVSMRGRWPVESSTRHEYYSASGPSVERVVIARRHGCLLSR